MFVVALIGFVVVVVWGLFNPFIGLLGLLAVNTFQPGELWKFFQVIHAERVMVLVVAFSWLINRGFKLEIPTITKRILLLWFVMFLSVPFSPIFRMGALLAALDFGKIIIYHVVTVNLVTTSRRLWVFVIAFALIMGGVAAWGSYLYWTGDVQIRSTGIGEETVQRALVANSNFANSNALGLALAFGLPFAVLLIFGEAIPIRILGAVTAVLITTTLVLTASRVAFFTFLFMVGVAVLSLKRRVVFGVLAFVILILTWLLMPQEHRDRYLSIGSLGQDTAYQARVYCRQAGLAMIRDYPILGVGIGQFGNANGSRYWPGGQMMWFEAHNLYIQVPAEIGFVGTVAFTIFVWQVFGDNRRLRRSLREVPKCPVWFRYLPLVCLSVLFGHLLSGWSAHTMTRDSWYLIAAIIAAQMGIVKREFGVAADVPATAPAHRGDTRIDRQEVVTQP